VILLPEQDVLSITTLGGNSSATGSPGFSSYSASTSIKGKLRLKSFSFAIVLYLFILFV
jgi:hypothetical protein